MSDKRPVAVFDSFLDYLYNLQRLGPEAEAIGADYDGAPFRSLLSQLLPCPKANDGLPQGTLP